MPVQNKPPKKPIGKKRPRAIISPRKKASNYLHSVTLDSPRGKMARAIHEQKKKFNPTTAQEAYESTAEGRSLLERRNAGLKQPGQPSVGEPPAYALPGSPYVTSSVSDWKRPDIRSTMAYMGHDAVKNHEMEHAYRQNKFADPQTKEVGPVVGDLIFRGEQFAMQEDRPLDHTVELSPSKSHDINWMRQQAMQHGYWNGRSMDDLIFNTEAGRNWYQQMVEGYR